MKKTGTTNRKRALCAILTAALAMGICGCGKTETMTDAGTTNGIVKEPTAGDVEAATKYDRSVEVADDF